MTTLAPAAVLDFWFGGDAHAVPEAIRKRWFEKDPAFDAECRDRFAPTLDAALAGALEHWGRAAESALALVIVLDQFSRNIHRDTPRAFAGDARALALAQAMVWRRWDRALAPSARLFVYLPFEHAESRAAQREAVRLMGELEAFPATRGYREWAVKHQVVIERFGRFPHRNAVLGRPSTAAEIAFLREPGSRF